MDTKKKLTILIIIGILFSTTFFIGVTQIDAGYRGVKTVWGEIQGEPLTEGLYFYNPISSDIHEIDCRTTNIVMRLSTYTKDVQQANIIFSLNYSLNEDNVHVLFKEIGINYQSRVIEPKIIQVVKEIIGKWNADTLVSNRNEATNEILDKLRAMLLVDNIIVSNVVIEDIEYTSQYETAIEQKQIATQKAIEAKNKTEQVREEAAQKVLSANAEAESMRIRSQALKENKGLVEYEAVQKWDGKLPVNIYGSAPLPFININK